MCGGAPWPPRSPATAVAGNLSFRGFRLQKSPREAPTRRFENDRFFGVRGSMVGFGFGVDFDLGFSDYGGSDLGVIGFSSVFGIRLLGFGFRSVSIRGPW